MRTPRWLAVFVFVIAINGVAAGRQLAMLVEVSPREVVEGGTLTEIVVRVAPEDRPALGEDVMLWVELTRNESRVLRKGWALKLDDPNQPITGEIVIPDGLHVLRVDLKGAGGRSTGVWWGDVDVSVPSPSPSPLPGSDPDDSDSDQQQQSAPAPGTAAASETGPASDQAPSPKPQASESASDPVPVPDDSDREQQQQAATVTATATATAAETASAARTEAETSVTAQSMPIPRRYVPPPFGEMTMAVTRKGQPVKDIDPSDLKIRVGGEPARIVFIDGPDEAVARIGFVIDLHAASSADIAWLSGMTRGLAETATAGPSMVFVGDANGEFSRCGIPSSQVADAVRSASDDPVLDLPSLIASALDRCIQSARGGGRAFLIVVTDGRGPRAGKMWAETHRSVASSGIPILVAGIWNQDFPSSLRKDLRKLASVSGGSVFYVQGAAQADDLIERYGALIEGSFVVGVNRSPGSEKVSVELMDSDGEIVASTALRESAWREIPGQTGRIRGLFTYWADAAVFKGCLTEGKIPVAMKADYLAVERAYLDARPGPGKPLLMTIDARVELQPTMEGEGFERALVIDRFIAVHPGESCE